MKKRELERSVIAERAIKVMAKVSGRRIEEITGEKTLDELGIESLAWMSMLCEFEKEFKIRIHLDGVFENAETVNEVVDYLKENLR